MLKELKFRKVKNNFQTRLREDMKQAQTSKKTLTAADKTSNMYKLHKNNYQNLLRNAIATSYKKQIRTLDQKSRKKGSNSQNKQIY